MLEYLACQTGRMISRAYLRDGLATIRWRPLAFGRGLSKSVYYFFLAASDYGWLEPNRSLVPAKAPFVYTDGSG